MHTCGETVTMPGAITAARRRGMLLALATAAARAVLSGFDR